MHSSKVLRCCSTAVLAVASFGIISVAAAQDTTAEPTEDAMMSEMMAMEGACPEGWAATMLEEMGMEMGMTDMATEEASTGDMTEEPSMEATMEMDMSMTEEPSMDATMEVTDEMSMMGVTCLYAELEGANEVPGPGDEDGYGVAFVSIDASTGNVCYDVAVANITLPAAAMHIHVNSEGVSGPVVVPFPTAPDAEGMASGCTAADTEGLLETIVSNPEGYYVNVHTSDFPDGAVRGQLMSWEDHEMMEGSSDMGDTSSDSGSTDMEMTPEATASS
jgi:hypothetical protein